MSGEIHANQVARIASLVPSLTELLFAMDLGEQVVARTGYCIHPRGAVDRVPKVGGTKTVNLEKLRRLAPTHVLVNVDENEKPTVERIAAFGPEIVVTHPIEVGDNADIYRDLGQRFDRLPQSQALVGALDAALREVRAQHFAPRRVLYLIWKDPWMTVSAPTYIARMLAEVGLEAVAPGADPALRYPSLDWDRLDRSAFDAVLLSSEPYSFGEADVAALRADPRLAGKPVSTIDGEMVSWYGSRAIAGLRYLLEFRRTLERCW